MSVSQTPDQSLITPSPVRERSGSRSKLVVAVVIMFTLVVLVAFIAFAGRGNLDPQTLMETAVSSTQTAAAQNNSSGTTITPAATTDSGGGIKVLPTFTPTP
jgi:hypothetical protein